jgi:pyruvate dehydrogenase E2 component (dihydrolipoamide acetyltransferase)
VAARISAITMPKWGIEMTEGTITGWRVGEGQRIERGAEILDVETEKIVNAVEAPAAGTLRRILARDGETQAVGALIGVIAEEQASDADIARFIESFVAAVVSFDADAAPAEARAVAQAAAVSAQPAGAVSATATTATATTGTATTGTATTTTATATTPTPTPTTATPEAADEARVSPIARRVAERLGVDLSKVTGTGRNGRISKEDVELFAAQAGTTPERNAAAAAAAIPHASAAPMPSVLTPTVPTPTVPPTASTTIAPRRIRMSARRGTIARRLLESKQSIPHFRLDVDVDFGPLLQHKRARPQGAGDRITVNDLLLRAAALALVRHPMVNAQLDGDEILQFEDADIAIAVAAEAGLVTPILRSANRKSVAAIGRESRDLIDRARRGALLREEISGGSFTISNLGMHGVTRFDAIINAPQVAILAVGAVSQRPVVRDGVLAVADVATLTLSADHRVVDGAVGAAFLSSLRGLLEEPAAL